jgi:hypothetical protein
MRTVPRTAAAGLALLLLGCAPQVGPSLRQAAPAFSLPEPDPNAGPQRVILVSVAGMTPSAYGFGSEVSVSMPTLAALARAGVAAETVLPVAPATPYPASTTLVTGERPAQHGVPADRLLGERGVRPSLYWHASHVRVPTLWQLAGEAGLSVAALGWPATVGASIDLLIPDIVPVRRGESWLELLLDSSTPWLARRLQQVGGDLSRVEPSRRDALFVTLACELLASEAPPRLLLLRLSQTQEALYRTGPGTAAARAAFERTAAAGLLAPVDDYALQSWNAVTRSNGGSAFVYARGEADAVDARQALELAAEDSRAFRIISAGEMLEMGADPEAWFGIEATPGYVFGSAAQGAFMEPAVERGASGYLAPGLAADPGFVAWGPGLRGDLRIPWMRQSDVAPTLALLMGIALPDVDGRPLIGALRIPLRIGAPAVSQGGTP